MSFSTRLEIPRRLSSTRLSSVYRLPPTFRFWATRQQRQHTVRTDSKAPTADRCLFSMSSVSSALTAAVNPSLSLTSKRYAALFLDAAGTLISPSESVAVTYQRFAQQHGISVPRSQMQDAFRNAFRRPVVGRRYIGDGRNFWRPLIQEATGSASISLFEDIYDYFCKAEAWTVPEDAVKTLERLKEEDIPVVVVSNFDTRLKRILAALDVERLLKDVVVSAEIEAEKPDKAIFEAALSVVDRPAERVVHVGDHEHNDVWGARRLGMDAWLWGRDVHSFTEISDRLLM